MLGYITLHLGGHYLPLTTIAWGVAIYLSFGNFQFLGAHGGIGDIPPISVFGYAFDEPRKLYYIIWILLRLWRCSRAANLLRSRQGRAIRALRGGKGMSESLGIDVFWVRLWVFVLAAGCLPELSGWLYAHMHALCQSGAVRSEGWHRISADGACSAAPAQSAARWSARPPCRAGRRTGCRTCCPPITTQQRQSRNCGVRPVCSSFCCICAAQRHRPPGAPIFAVTA